MSTEYDDGAVATGAAAAGQVASAPHPLASLLRDDMVSWEVLERRYGSLLELVRVLLGVVPNCDRYLEIWPPAFRSYNVMVPNFLNLPSPVLGVGGAPGDVVGLGMYVSSRVGGVPVLHGALVLVRSASRRLGREDGAGSGGGSHGVQPG